MNIKVTLISLISYVIKIFLFFFFYLVSENVAAQQQVEVSGFVMDSLTQQPLAHALIYTSDDTSGNFIAFVNANDKGQFKLSFIDYGNNTKIHIRYLGYQEKYIKLVDIGKTTMLDIYLVPKQNTLKELVISEKRPPITQNADTTVYEVKYFVDSTEYNVEDILKKIPGVEVKSNGTIMVNGKNVEKLLVEGSDLFGLKYTIGTKNIRAGYLDKVEIIDHYQENPVLSDVNTSDAIVLNLRFKEEKKNILNSTFDIGSGVGLDKDWKFMSNVNAFSIASKKKLVLLGSNGNTGTSYNMNEIESIYNNFNEKDIKSPIHNLPDFQIFSQIKNPGLPNEFIDATKHSFFTLRYMHTIGKQWEMNINSTFYHQGGTQLTSNTQTFFPNEASYQLSFRQELILENTLKEIDLYLNHVSKNKERSIQAYFKIGNNRTNNSVDIIESLINRQRDYNILEKELQKENLAAIILTQKLGKRSVFQAQIKTTYFTNPQKLITENEDYLNLLTTLNYTTFLSQELFWENNLTRLTGRYIVSNNYFILEIEPFYEYYKSGFQNEIIFSSEDRNTSINPFSNYLEQIQGQKSGLSSNLYANITSSTTLQLYLQAKNIENIYADSLFFPFQTINYKINLQKKIKKNNEGNFTYGYQEQDPLSHFLLTTAYFYDTYSIHNQSARDIVSSNHFLNLRYSNRSPIKFQSWYFNLRYNFLQKRWRNASDFVSSLVLASPFFSDQNNQFSIKGYWDCFLPKLRTNITVNALYSNSFGKYLVQNETLGLSNQSYELGTNFSLSPKSYIRLNIENRLSGNYNFNKEERIRNINYLFIWHSTFACTYLNHGWQIITSWNRSAYQTNTGSAALLNGIQVNVRKNLTLNQRPMIIGLRIVNIPNVKQYSTFQNNTYFSFENQTQAVPTFALFNIDYSF